MLALGSVKSILTDSVKSGRVHFDMHGFLTSVVLADLNLAGMAPQAAGGLRPASVPCSWRWVSPGHASSGDCSSHLELELPEPLDSPGLGLPRSRRPAASAPLHSPALERDEAGCAWRAGRGSALVQSPLDR